MALYLATLKTNLHGPQKAEVVVLFRESLGEKKRAELLCGSQGRTASEGPTGLTCREGAHPLSSRPTHKGFLSHPVDWMPVSGTSSRVEPPGPCVPSVTV